MLFSQALQESIHLQFISTLPTLGLRREEVLAQLQSCSEEERVILEFFYNTMPASDLGDYEFSLYRRYAEFGVFLAENSPWSSRISESLFLNYVIYYRINNESVEDCRPFFHDALAERIKGKSMKEAALEVNLWCAEHVTYQATDERTVSPLTALKSAYGRCGEESTFVVTALRSVGIPARQVYTQRWAHCDDNHAWVEVWCDGDWYYLGACEPEPVLNRGWFTEAAGRAMLMDSKAFLPIEKEEVITKNGQSIILNELSRYAPAKRFTVTVKNPKPMAGVTVRFELLNGSEFSPLATLVTGAEGWAELLLGLGSIHIHAVKDGRFIEALTDTAETDSIELDFTKAIEAEPDTQEDFDLHAPKDSAKKSIPLTEEQKALKRNILQNADQKRKAYAKEFYRQEAAEKLAEQFSCKQDVLEILKAAQGNFQEIFDFLSLDFGSKNKDLQLQLLLSLTKKDYRDIHADTLAEHFESALNHRDDVSPELFAPYVLCPRAYYEQLTPYRKLLLSLFDEQALAAFCKQPMRIWEYTSQFQPDPARESERIVGTPTGVIRSGQAGKMSRKVLFTSICRTLGIPARINPVDMAAEYYQNGTFHNVENTPAEKAEATELTLSGGNENWAYLHNWTMAVLKDGIYQTLELADHAWADGTLKLSLIPGDYRLITSCRLPNGNQFARKYCFRLANGQKKMLGISLRQAGTSDMLEDIAFTPFQIYNDQNTSVSSDAVASDKTTVFIWLEEGREPTEHILNELIEAQGKLNTMNCNLVLIIGDRAALENATFLKACKAIPAAQIYYSNFSETAVTMARRMYVDPDKLPLVVVARNGHGIYACSGYNVGTADLLIKIITAAH